MSFSFLVFFLYQKYKSVELGDQQVFFLSSPLSLVANILRSSLAQQQLPDLDRLDIESIEEQESDTTTSGFVR